MRNALLWIIVGVLAALSLVSLPFWLRPRHATLAQAGGTELVYELDPAAASPGVSRPELARRVVEILKRRVDPYNRKGLVWSVDGDHIVVRVPLPNKETRPARQATDRALADLRAAALDPAAVQQALRLSDPAEREKALSALAVGNTPRLDLLRKLAAAQDAHQKTLAAIAAGNGPPGATPQPLLDQRFATQQALQQATAALYSPELNMDTVQAVLDADDPSNPEARKLLAQFAALHPAQRAPLEALFAAHEREMRISGGENTVDDLQRLISFVGVLDFRITISPEQLGTTFNQPSTAQQQAQEVLDRDGPLRAFDIPDTAIRARWFLIDHSAWDNFGIQPDGTIGGFVGFIIARHAGEPYVLCYDDAPSLNHALTHDPRRRPWTLTAGIPQADPYSGSLALPFTLDPVGAGYMGDLTSANKGRAMAILLDDRAITAPTIQSTITSNAQITFGMPTSTRSLAMIKREADSLKQVMDAGALPATVNRRPLSQRVIPPDPTFRPFPWWLLTLAPWPLIAILLATIFAASLKGRARPAPPAPA